MKRWIFKLSVVIWIILILGTTVMAADDENYIQIVLSNQEESVCLKDADVTLYEIAVFTNYKKHEYIVNDTYQFVMSKLDFSTTEKGCTKENAEIIAEYIQEHTIKGTVKKSDDYGKVTFDNLKKGIYLVSVDVDKEYSVDAFLIEVPLWEDGSYNDSVTANPKIELVPGENDGDDETITTEDEDEKLPQTGQLKWPIPVMLVLGITLIVAGYADDCFRGYKDE